MKSIRFKKSVIILLVILVAVFAYNKSDKKDVVENFNQDEVKTYRVSPDVGYSDYKNLDRKLAGPRTYQEISKLTSLNVDVLTRNYLDFPDWAPYYIPLSTVDGVDTVDIDMDGKKETVVYYSCRGCNGTPRSLDIIKDGRIIFTADGSNLKLTPLDSEIGFYIDNPIIPREDRYTRIKFLADEGGSYYVKSEEDLRYTKVISV